jgi:cardiolipin synthase
VQHAPDTNVLVDEGQRTASYTEYQELLEANATETGTRVMLDRLLEATRRITGNDFLYTGNDASLLVDGPGTFKAMFADIANAKDSIHLETFILLDDEVGRTLATRLIESRQRGVDVRVLIDAFGSVDLPETFISRLRDNGIELQKFHPLDPTEDLRVWRSNNRDHRKILVIDGKIAYCGGINFSGVYSKGSFSASGNTSATNTAWRDTHVRIQGPAVERFQQLFLKMWNMDIPENEQLQGPRYFPQLEAQGEMLAGVIASSGGDDKEYDIYSVLAAAISHAQKSVWITQAYFAPDEAFLEIIKTAAGRGVDVRLLLPGVSDAPLVLQASRSSYQELLEAGVRIYERSGSMLHAKTVVVDGVWSTIGSANFDYRSFIYNYELNAVLVSSDFGQAMQKLFLVDLQHAHEISLQQWQRRSLLQRLKEAVGNLIRPWL